MPKAPIEAQNCDSEGIMSTLAGIAGSLQANEVIKSILKIGKPLFGEIMVFNALDLNFRKVKLKEIQIVKTTCMFKEKYFLIKIFLIYFLVILVSPAFSEENYYLTLRSDKVYLRAGPSFLNIQ